MKRRFPMEPNRAFKIAVLGSASVDEDSEAGQKAFRIGRAVGLARDILLTGGCTGLPHAAVRGATSAGGLTVAISPAMNRESHIAVHGYPIDSGVILFTGMGTKGRNVILVRSADACVCIGGGMGTLNEFTIAFDELGPAYALGVLSQTGGLSDELERLVWVVGKKPQAALIIEPEPERLIERIYGHVRKQ
jgi:uncharacterized protein (TIGR00725 family)